MIARKVGLSLLVAAASGAYVWSQPELVQSDGLLDMSTSGIDGASLSQPPVVAPRPDGAPSPGDIGAVQPPSLSRRVVVPAATVPPPPVMTATAESERPPPDAPGATLSPDGIPLPRPRPEHQAPVVAEPDRRRPFDRSLVSRVSMTTATGPASAGYVDGAYVGPVTDAYYGLVQVEALINGGRLEGIKVLRYPSDRRTSVMINRQALPMLRDEVVAAQSAKVNIISGATLTSEAFIRSLGGALAKARA